MAAESHARQIYLTGKRIARRFLPVAPLAQVLQQQPGAQRHFSVIGFDKHEAIEEILVDRDGDVAVTGQMLAQVGVAGV